MGAHYALILRFGGWKFFMPSKCATLGLRLDLKVRVTQQIDTAMQNDYKWIKSQWESTLVRETGSNLKIAS